MGVWEGAKGGGGNSAGGACRKVSWAVLAIKQARRTIQPDRQSEPAV